MSDRELQKTIFSPGRINGAAPSENTYYVLVLFDISNQKKYRLLLKTIKQYGIRAQKSVFEGQLTLSQYKALVHAIDALMAAPSFFDGNDVVRIYKIAGSCEVTAFGRFDSYILERNIFL